MVLTCRARIFSDACFYVAQIAEVVRQFNTKPAAACHRNLDMSINGHLADGKLWLEAYKRDVKPRLFDSEHA